MSETEQVQHTPGPWFIEATALTGVRVVHGAPDADGFRDDVRVRGGALDKEVVANVRLIAAAPAYAKVWSMVPKYVKDAIFDALNDEAWQEVAIAKAEAKS